MRYFITLGRSSETKHSMGTELRRQRRGWTRRWIYEIYQGSSIHHHRRSAHRKRRIMFQRSPIVNSLSRIIPFVEFHPLPHSLTVDVYAAKLLPHRTRINLAHVTTTIRFADLSDFQAPRVRLLVDDGVPCVVRHHSSLQRQHGLIR